MPFHSLFWFLPVSLSGWFAVSKAVAASTGFVFRVVCSFKSCFRFHPVSILGRIVVSKVVAASTGFAFRVVCSFKSCFRFHPVSFSGRPAVSNTVLASSFSGFGPSLFQPLPLTLPPTWHSSGTGQRRGVLDRCLPFNLFRSAACVAAQRPAPEFGVGG